MAEGWLRHLAGDRYDVFSAGTQPVGLNPGAVNARRSRHRYRASPIKIGEGFHRHAVRLCDHSVRSRQGNMSALARFDATDPLEFR